MQLLHTIGTVHLAYKNRPTVKVVIHNNGKVLLLNNGLLPGGGVNAREGNIEALKREVREEIGATIADIQPIGAVVQYRAFLEKKYHVYGYTARLDESNLPTDPQDQGERNFQTRWVDLAGAIDSVDREINKYSALATNDDMQGTLYNLMTTRILLKNSQI